MADGKFISLGGVGLLAVICCAAPFLLVAAGSFGISAWLAAAGYVVIPIALAATGAATGLYFYGRRRSASSVDTGCCSTNDKTRVN